MAIKKPAPKPEKRLPADLQHKADRALFLQIAESRYRKLYDESRKEFTAALELDDACEAVLGETFAHQSGTFRYNEGRAAVNVAKLIDLVTLEPMKAVAVICGAVSMFNATNLKAMGLGECVESADDKPPVLTFRANEEYRSLVTGLLESAEGNIPGVSEEEEVVTHAK